MKIAFFSIILNNHQANLADEMYKLLDEDFVFVELENLSGDNKKGSTEDYTKRPYLLQSWKDETSAAKAMEIAMTYDVCMFDGGFNYQKARMKTGKMTFEFSERWLKGPKNFLSPRLWRNILTYHLCCWRNKPLYKLCASAFAAHDQHLLGTFFGKCYKFGYFTEVLSDLEPFESQSIEPSQRAIEPRTKVRIMWCARFIDWKHPELAIECVKKVIGEGGKGLTLDMYGDGPLRSGLEVSVEKLGLSDVITFHGNVPNNQIMQAMRESDIFLFTSDKGEGWGAVANEAMANGCCLVAGDKIGAAPYLIQDGINGFMFRDQDATSLCKIVKHVIENPEERVKLQKQARKDMKTTWSPQNAAKSFLRLVDDLQNGRETSILEGPCSKA